jgi:light-regulated signal transduction histidine kinase (bacteriophytochrome)
MYVSTNATIQFDKNGNPTHINGSLRDITQRRLNELEIESQNKRLQIQNKELEQFSYIASHDFARTSENTYKFCRTFKRRICRKVR